ncbi:MULTISPECIES: transposase [Shewanella]|uniref:transposase n=1 Tax=Shewanella TaxID=22 RepID=UPI001404CD10|nr:MULTISPECIES: transposase [Shewanella]NCO71592.1 transposase [Shewanella vesiculosa]NCP73457.1 transposase [Shewanella vesiculosa]NCP92490.1 transposase [Shewanella vesiculosa]NCP99435.1 transposase [Shewanella vesiculosa]NCQ44450.1 transposase [Shewanella frigidimarina]
MIKGTRHITEFKQEAVNQAIKQGYSVNDVSERLGFSSKTLYAWSKTFSKLPKQRENEQNLQTKFAQLKMRATSTEKLSTTMVIKMGLIIKFFELLYGSRKG